jgi:hypothetical protein
VGIFCPQCAPTDSEEIRTYRQAGADRKADKLEGWAAKREAKAAQTFKHNEPYTTDYAFNTQPGHIPLRARIIAQEDKAFESLNTAKGFRERAESLRHVRVAGDAAKADQILRDQLDTIIKKGSRVNDVCFGDGVVVGVFKKSYRVTFNKDGSTYSRDKIYIRPIGDINTNPL